MSSIYVRLGLLAFGCAVLNGLGKVSPSSYALLALAVYVCTGGSHTLYLAWHTLPRDIRGAYRYVRLLLTVYAYQKRDATVPEVFAETARKTPEKPCLLFEDVSWTFRDLEEFSNRVANFFLSRGFKPGDCIALFMDNRPVRQSIYSYKNMLRTWSALIAVESNV